MGKTRSILIVEDDKEMQEIYKDMFKGKEAQYKVSFESNAEEALNTIDKNIFDVIILDIIMTPMPGDSFFVHLRTVKKQQTPVLVVSVLDEDMLRNMKEINHIQFLQKPINEEELFKNIEDVIQKFGTK
ncbi:MAG: response regulator [Candidatus Margulisiibacteriota bacterium]|nr:response regulator [Candidatus Margulisiibacteriota bacterium]